MLCVLLFIVFFFNLVSIGFRKSVLFISSVVLDKVCHIYSYVLYTYIEILTVYIQLNSLRSAFQWSGSLACTFMVMCISQLHVCNVMSLIYKTISIATALPLEWYAGICTSSSEAGFYVM